MLHPVSPRRPSPHLTFGETLSGLLGPRGAVHSSTRPAGDAGQTAAPPCHSPHVHGVLQSSHFVIRQEVIDGHKVLLELLLEQVHPERVCAHVAASTWETRTRCVTSLCALHHPCARQHTTCITRGDVIPTLKPSTVSFAGLGRHSRSLIVWDHGSIRPPAHGPSTPGRLWACVREITSQGGQVAPLTHPPELTFAWPEASPREQNTEPHVGPEWGCRAPKNNRSGRGKARAGGFPPERDEHRRKRLRCPSRCL